MKEQIVRVGIAELKTAKPPVKLVSTGLGSCVGICLYDPLAKISGLAHIMLPNSRQAKNANNLAKFADTAVKVLIAELLKERAIKKRLIAKIAGGAQMFNLPGASDFMRIGQRNVEASKKALKEAGIPLIAEDVGGNYGRSIEFCSVEGTLLVRTIGFGEKII